MNFFMPLDNVVSWEDYQQKQEQKEKQGQEQINKALAAGQFRLIDSDVILTHICREVATNQKYRIQRIALPDPKLRTWVTKARRATRGGRRPTRTAS
jgi:hypothetical protein